MTQSTRQTHWENVYKTKHEIEVSWFQETSSPSLELLELIGARQASAIIDIGGGVSRLVDGLLSQNFEKISVLDLSAAALASARHRLGESAAEVTWIVADVTQWQPSDSYDIWHDRAAFHFLTGETEQQAYIDRLNRALLPGGHAIIGRSLLTAPRLAVVFLSRGTVPKAYRHCWVKIMFWSIEGTMNMPRHGWLFKNSSSVRCAG